ncbi:alpha/beta fold hydrolase [Amorphoplanes nipponensis]|uniref:Alpha/beta hydrolase n=1 Tax=Actinoplanes nipponensis TaxID=135950 RepID=A0A919JQI2_9ACTN|nr:alpha/beta fold hydrolase [Actinoplanes nipponensis]GIE53933.1 alpha/beta hydrolase [Actinoplanes nipponensis]
MDITVGDITLRVRDTGSGVPVMLLHGWPDTGDLWRHQVPALTAAGYRVIVPDLRGFGGSGKPADVAAYALPALIGDVVGLLDALDVREVHLVGHDWGAAIAWMTAALAPHRIASLTAMSVGHPAAFRAAGLRQREKSWYMLLFQFAGVAERWLSDDDFGNLREWSAHPDIEAVVERLADPAALTAGLALYRANLSPEALFGPPAPLPPVTVPAMGLWSSGDFALIEEGMTGSAGHVSGPWRYERVEGAGHWLQLDAPETVNALLLDFLGAQPRHRAGRPSRLVSPSRPDSPVRSA